MYIELLKNCLLDNIYGSIVESTWSGNKGSIANKDQVENGTYWPLRAHTMIGMKRLNNIEYCVREVLSHNIPGDFIETGVWRGGACIFMAGLNKYLGMSRKIFVADSFQGLPPPDPRYAADARDVHHTFENLVVSLDQVKSNFEKYGLLDDNVVFVEGFFEHSLKMAPIDKLSILRLDGDMYSSTIQVLEHLYDKLSDGGFLIVDDFGLLNCKQAILDFREDRNITSPIIKIDDMSSYWKK